MNLKEFLKFEWKKLIIPFILIGIFTIFIIWFISVSKPAEKYPCEMRELWVDAWYYQHRNDTLNYEKTARKLEDMKIKMDEEMDSSAFLFGIDDFGIQTSIRKIDPIFPLPCSFLENKMGRPYYGCRYYMSEQSVMCMYNISGQVHKIEDLAKLPSEPPKYRKLSFFNISLNVLILFIEGYLFSCLIIWTCNKMMRK